MGELTETEAAELSELEADMADSRGRSAGNWQSGYWSNPAKQERARALYQKLDGGPPAEPSGLPGADRPPSSALDAKAAEIMADPSYWKSEELQAKVRALYEEDAPEASQDFEQATSEIVAEYGLESDAAKMVLEFGIPTLHALEAGEAFASLDDSTRAGFVNLFGGEADISYQEISEDHWLEAIETESGKAFVNLCGEHAKGWANWIVSGMSYLSSNWGEGALEFIESLPPKQAAMAYLAVAKMSAINMGAMDG